MSGTGCNAARAQEAGGNHGMGEALLIGREGHAMPDAGAHGKTRIDQDHGKNP